MFLMWTAFIFKQFIRSDPVGWAAGCDGERGLGDKTIPPCVMCIETLRVNGPAEKNAYTLTLEIKAVFKNYMERHAVSKALPPNTYQRKANGNTKTVHITSSFQHPSRKNRANCEKRTIEAARKRPST